MVVRRTVMLINGHASLRALRHVRSINWLKAALLCFPHVLRMVPQNYILSESREMREFSETLGLAGRPLLQAINVREPVYESAQHIFLRRLRTDFDRDPAFFHREFSRERAL